jgi:hypothetical protein
VRERTSPASAVSNALRRELSRDRLFLVERSAKRFPDEDAAKLRRERRDNTIRAAVDDGMSYREVGAAIGLSHSRVAQIVTSQPRP